MVISTDKLRRNLRGAAAQAEIEQLSLRGVISDHLYSRFKATNSGHRLSGVSANGHSTQIANDQGDVMFEVWSQLLDLFDVCKTSLASTSDSEILTEMLYRLGATPVTSYQNDYRSMNL